MSHHMCKQHYITWWGKSQDRAGWRAAIECLLQLISGLERMNIINQSGTSIFIVAVIYAGNGNPQLSTRK